jgi:hypothetical protein
MLGFESKWKGLVEKVKRGMRFGLIARWCFFLVLPFVYHSLLQDHCDPEMRAAKLAVHLSTNSITGNP